MFSFKPDDINILRGYLHNSLKSKHNEFEIRFSTNKHDELFAENVQAIASSQKPENYRFSPVIEKDIFFRSLNVFKNQNLKTEQVLSIDSMFNNYTRKTEILDNDNQVVGVTWMRKLKSKFNDFWDANMRVCLSIEEPLQTPLTMNESSTYIRRKDRTSFYDNCIRYDFTIVTTTKNNQVQKPTYEIEIEFVPYDKFPSSHVNDAVNHLVYCATLVMKILQDSPSIMTLSEKHNIQIEYNVLITSGQQQNSQYHQQNHQQQNQNQNSQRQQKIRFIGAQPETLHKHHVAKIQSGQYSVTEKYDGERALLFISGNSEVYILGRNFRFRHSGLTSSKDQGSLLDVEIVNNTIFAFDILFFRGIDLRNKKEYNLRKRLENLETVVGNITNENNQKTEVFPLYAKPHFFSDLKTIFERWQSKDYNDDIPRDGFICTPINDPYPNKAKWSNLLKWKPVEINSIDFLVKIKETKENNEQTWNLFVGEKDNNFVPFEPWPLIKVNPSSLEFIQNTSMENMIVECVWDFEKSTFVPIKWRQDKRVPNYKTIALDVWQSIHNPVYLDDLLCSPFFNMRKLHNQIKSHIIGKSVYFANKHNQEYECESYKPETSNATETVEATEPNEDVDIFSKPRKHFDWSEEEEEEETVDDQLSNAPTLRILDLACGRGGDLWKWISHTENRNVEYYGIDINEDYLAEARKRAEEITESYAQNAHGKRTSKGTMKCVFLQCDIRKSKPVFPLAETNAFDIISCQFAMHYFYESQSTWNNFMTVVKKNLKINGVFTSSLFDGYGVYDLCTRGYNKQNNNGTGFDIMPLFDGRLGLQNIKAKEFNIGITAVLSGDSDVILKEATKEYLVFADLFIRRMANTGFHLQECKKFNDVQLDENVDIKLSEVEQLYSQLHRYYIFVCNPHHVHLFATYWNSFEYDNECFYANEVNSESESENAVVQENDQNVVKDRMLLFVRQCGVGKGCLTHERCLLNILESITGKTLKESGGIDFKQYANAFNVCINLIPTSIDGEPNFELQQLFLPEMYLEDVKTVHFLQVGEHYNIIARYCDQVCGKVLTFSSRLENNSEDVCLTEGESDDAVHEEQPVQIGNSITEQQVNQVEQNAESNREPVKMFMSRPITGKNCWTMKELKEFARSVGVDKHINSSVRKKEDFVNQMEMYKVVSEMQNLRTQ